MPSSQSGFEVPLDALLSAASQAALGEAPRYPDATADVNPYVDDLARPDDDPTGSIPLTDHTKPTTAESTDPDETDDPTVPIAIPILPTGSKPGERKTAKEDPHADDAPFADERSRLRRLTDLGRLPTLVTTSILSRLSARRWNRAVSNREVYVEQLSGRQRRMLRLLDTFTGAAAVGTIIVRSVPALAHALEWTGDAVQEAVERVAELRNDVIGLDGKPGLGPEPQAEPAASPSTQPTPSPAGQAPAPEAPTNEPQPEPGEPQGEKPPATPAHITYKAEPGDGSLRVSKEALLEYAKSQGIDPDQIKRSHVRAVNSAFVNDTENDGRFYGGGRMNLGQKYEFNDAAAKIHEIVGDLEAGGDGFPEATKPVAASGGMSGFGPYDGNPAEAQPVSAVPEPVAAVNVTSGDTWDTLLDNFKIDEKHQDKLVKDPAFQLLMEKLDAGYKHGGKPEDFRVNLPSVDKNGNRPLPHNVSEAIMHRFAEMLEEETDGRKPSTRV